MTREGEAIQFAATGTCPVVQLTDLSSNLMDSPDPPRKSRAFCSNKREAAGGRGGRNDVQLSRYLDRTARVNAELLGIAAREAKSDIALANDYRYVSRIYTTYITLKTNNFVAREKYRDNHSVSSISIAASRQVRRI